MTTTDLDFVIESTLAKDLTHTEKSVRDAGFSKLSYLITRPDLLYSSLEFLKIWKALFYCYWMSDKQLVQQELASNLAQLVVLIPQPSTLPFLKGFWATIGKEWRNIDHIRLNKYYNLLREIHRATFEVLKKNPGMAGEVMEILSGEEGPLNAKSAKTADGLRYHTIEVFFPILAKTIPEPLPELSFLVFFNPFLKLARETPNEAIVARLCTEIFDVYKNDQFAEEESDLKKYLSASLSLERLSSILSDMVLDDNLEMMTKNRKQIKNYLNVWSVNVGIPFKDHDIVTGMDVTFVNSSGLKRVIPPTSNTQQKKKQKKAGVDKKKKKTKDVEMDEDESQVEVSAKTRSPKIAKITDNVVDVVAPPMKVKYTPVEPVADITAEKVELAEKVKDIVPSPKKTGANSPVSEKTKAKKVTPVKEAASTPLVSPISNKKAKKDIILASAVTSPIKKVAVVAAKVSPKKDKTSKEVVVVAEIAAASPVKPVEIASALEKKITAVEPGEKKKLSKKQKKAATAAAKTAAPPAEVVAGVPETVVKISPVKMAAVPEIVAKISTVEKTAAPEAVAKISPGKKTAVPTAVNEVPVKKTVVPDIEVSAKRSNPTRNVVPKDTIALLQKALKNAKVSKKKKSGKSESKDDIALIKKVEHVELILRGAQSSPIAKKSISWGSNHVKAFRKQEAICSIDEAAKGITTVEKPLLGRLKAFAKPLIQTLTVGSKSSKRNKR